MRRSSAASRTINSLNSCNPQASSTTDQSARMSTCAASSSATTPLRAGPPKASCRPRRDLRHSLRRARRCCPPTRHGPLPRRRRQRRSYPRSRIRGLLSPPLNRRLHDGFRPHLRSVGRSTGYGLHRTLPLYRARGLPTERAILLLARLPMAPTLVARYGAQNSMLVFTESRRDWM